MSSKVEVLWSPNEDNTFVAYSSSINLYQVHGPENQHISRHPESSLKVADHKYAVHCAENSDINFVKCVAWYPHAEPKNLLAVGQASGRIVLTGFGDPGDDELFGKEFVPRHSRQCNFLAWNPGESRFLAQGMEKFRNDPCIVIWDVTATHTHSESSERSRFSSSEHGSISRPYLEIGSGDTSSSFAWFDERNFVTGMNNRYLRLYDLANPTKPRLTTQHRSVCGVCVDVENNHRLASFGEQVVAVWDVRSFDRPVFTLPESKHVAKIGWCLTRPGVLTVICKDSPTLRLYDIRHAVNGSDDIEPVIIDRTVQPFGEMLLSSFAWHPRHENRLLVASGPNQIKDLAIYERIPMAWSPDGSLTWASGKRTMSCVDDSHLHTQDISIKIKERVLKGYGLQCTDIHANTIIVAGEPHLRSLWKWIALVRQPQFQRGNPAGKRTGVYNMGVKQMLKLYYDHYNPMVSEQVSVGWNPNDSVTFAAKSQYRSTERSLALALCGWVQDTSTDFIGYLDALTLNGEGEKAAAIAVFFLKIKKALQILSTSASTATGDGKMNLNAVAMALAGYNEHNNQLWRETCSTQRSQLASPYLRAIFAFLASDSPFYRQVLAEDGMSVEDRVAFAITYLPDAQLKEFINDITSQLVAAGNLDGMLLTGLSSEGIDLLEQYVNQTSDVQTAAITAVFTGTAQACKDERIPLWINSYRELLNQWSLYFERCHFDIVSQVCESSNPHPPHVYINCNFCGKSITINKAAGRAPSSSSTPMNHFATANRPPHQQRQKITCCPSCRKALPRCAVCLGTLGTASSHPSGSGHDNKNSRVMINPFKDWFSWCQTCRHGGHASHLLDWFKTHSDCPVTGCTCKCMSIDDNDKSIKSKTLSCTSSPHLD